MSKSPTYTLHVPVSQANRAADEAREGRIAALTKLITDALASGDNNEFRRLQREHKAAVLARSQEQLGRMRRAAAEAKA